MARLNVKGGIVEWIHEGQNRDQWPTVVNVVLKFLSPFLDQSSNCYFS